MSQHTPGPWDISGHAVPDWAYQVGIYALGTDIATVKTSEADARLIAAAPQLLAALQETLDELRHLAGTDPQAWDTATRETISDAQWAIEEATASAEVSA